MIGIRVEGGGSLEPLCHEMISDRCNPRTFWKHGHSYGSINHGRFSPVILGMTNEIMHEGLIKTVRPALVRWSEQIDKQ
ncbi:hypothetical protein HYT05_03295 [Candidatus Kaiserbacteria bacterium]|nr:hypothetical protein [Candidatus Kaiserbacteria bacterium]